MKLTDGERDALTAVAESLTGKGTLTALSAYGSRVAGYARPDSDYDILVVVKGFRNGVRYRYVHEPLEASALVVDEGLLGQDARTSNLGEFVVGRLLNVYEPILNGEALRAVELEYKRRVIIEALLELSSDYSEFSRNLEIPYEYFLFDKLRKRAQIYPPALYSYIQTYTCAQAGENIKATVSGFREAAQRTAGRANFLVTHKDHVVMLPEKMKGDAFTKLSVMFALTARGVTQYAVHGYAGRVGLDTFRNEATSKLRRMRKRQDPPPELERPRSLIKLEEGELVSQVSEMNNRLAKMAGFGEFKVREKEIGEPYTTTRVLTLTSGAKERSFVVKNFSDVRSLKWALLGIWAVAARKFSMAPIARLAREYQATLILREAGLHVPAIAAVAPDERIIVKEFVEGPTLSKLLDEYFQGHDGVLERVRDFAAVLARVHSLGLALGDAKASNVIVAGDGMYLTDLEQAVEGGDSAWDVAEFLYYTAKLSRKEANMEKLVRAFLESYSSKGDPAVIRKAAGSRYLTPFRPFLTPGMARTIRDQLQQYS